MSEQYVGAGPLPRTWEEYQRERRNAYVLGAVGEEIGRHRTRCAGATADIIYPIRKRTPRVVTLSCGREAMVDEHGNLDFGGHLIALLTPDDVKRLRDLLANPYTEEEL